MYSGKLFPQHKHTLKGNHDVLNLTKPAVVESCHIKYLEAGADIVETNTFCGTTLAQTPYGLADKAYEMTLAGARIAVECAKKWSTPDKPRFVAGAIGPTAASASVSVDPNHPEARNTSMLL